MKNIAVIALLAAALLCSAGCESVRHYNRTKVAVLDGVKKKERQKKPHGTVKLFQGQEEVPGPYDIIAMLSVAGKAGEEAQFITAFLYHGADLGADGVIFYRMNIATTMQGGGGFAFGKGGGFGIKSSQEAFYRGEVIRFQP